MAPMRNWKVTYELRGKGEPWRPAQSVPPGRSPEEAMDFLRSYFGSYGDEVRDLRCHGPWDE